MSKSGIVVLYYTKDKEIVQATVYHADQDPKWTSKGKLLVTKKSGDKVLKDSTLLRQIGFVD